MVKIVHPSGLEAMVPASAVPHHRAAGWEVAKQPETEEIEPPQDAGVSHVRRRRARGEE